MEYSSYHQPYSHRTRFKVIRSTTKLIQTPKPIINRSISQFKFIQNGTNSSKPTIIKMKSIDKSATTIAKSIGNKYKWIRTSLKKTESNRLVRIIYKYMYFQIPFSFKFDRRKILARSVINGRVTKRKPRASLSKCFVHIRGIKFHTHPNGKCLQRLSKF